MPPLSTTPARRIIRTTVIRQQPTRPASFVLKPLHVLIPVVILIGILPFALQQQNSVLISRSSNTTALDMPAKPKRIRNRSNRTRLHKPLTNLTADERHLERLNSLDYYACCGLGHRLTKLGDAWFVASRINYALKAFWGFCDEHDEVFYHLFGSQPLEEIKEVKAQRRILLLRNEVPGTKPLIRRNESNCNLCDPKKIYSDVAMYQSLWKRFKFMSRVDDFMSSRNFSSHTVIGMHIRAGNGETGDFAKKKRSINNVDKWVARISQHVRDLIKKNKIVNPLLYIATDTPSMITHFSKALSELPVVDLPQQRAETGVLFGEWGAKHAGSQCMEGWIQAVTDMMILSSSSLMIAARPSSFVQSMPMSMAFSRNQSFCEVSPDAESIQCSSSFLQWCCAADTVEVMQGIQQYEYLRMPEGPVNLTSMSHHIRTRRDDELVLPMHLSTVKKTDLPFSWDKLIHKTPGQ